eukprot:6162-Heterococcus_DN1.PRE.5
MWRLAAVVATLSRALPASSFHAALHALRNVCCKGSKFHTRNLRHSVHTAAAASRSQHQCTQTMSTATGADSGRAVHNARQAASFDQSVGYFASDAATPPEVVPKLHKIAIVAAAAALRPLDHATAAAAAQRRLVDVGTGTGCLIPHYLEITGVDLSSKMLAVLKERYPDVSTFCGDFLDYTPAQADAATAAAATGSGDDSTQQEQLQDLAQNKVCAITCSNSVRCASNVVVERLCARSAVGSYAKRRVQ